MAWVSAAAAALRVCRIGLAGNCLPARMALPGDHVWLWWGRAWVRFLPGGVLVTSFPCPSREGESQNTKVDNAFRNCSAFLVFSSPFFPPDCSQI